MEKRPLRDCLRCFCLCKVLKKTYRVRPAHKNSSTFNSLDSAEVKSKEQHTFMNQLQISHQNTPVGVSLLCKVKTLPADTRHYKSLISRHDDIDCDSAKAAQYDDVGGVLILRTRLGAPDEEPKTDDPRHHTQ